MNTLIPCYIYKLKDVNYIGSTYRGLKDRRYTYMGTIHNPKAINHNAPVHKYMRQNNIIPELILIKQLFLTKKGCRIAEQFMMDEYDTYHNGLNTYLAYRNSTAKQRKKIKPDVWHRHYAKHGHKYRARSNRYYRENKGAHNAYSRANYQKNKDKYNATRNMKIKCSCCGSVVSKRGISQHKKSKKCRELSSDQTNDQIA